MVAAPTSLTDLRRWRVPGPVVLLIAAFLVVAIVMPEHAETVGFLGLVIGMITGGILFFTRSRSLEASETRVWRFFAMAILLAGTGVAVVGILTESGLDLPAFGPLDAFFLIGYLFLIAGLVRMARVESGGREWLPTILDALVGGISLTVVIWTVLLHDLLDSLSGQGWQAVIAPLYPILDVAAIVVLIIMVIRRSHFHFDLRLMFVAGGLVAQVINDIVYMRRGVGASFAEASPPWVVLLIAALMWVLAAAIVDVTPRQREFPEMESPLWALAWPYLLGAVLLGMHVSTYRNIAPGSDAILILDALLAVGILVFFRQLLAIRRNQVRVEKQRSDLVASVSHELRTPLTAIVGYLNLLDSDGDDFPEEARREMIGEASDQAKHMASLVSDLVMLARGVHRNLPLEITLVSSSAMVHSATRGIDPGGKSIDLVVESDAMIRVDPVRIQQALTNVLSNAVRYGGERAVLISRVENGTDLVYEMHDNGEGVPTKYEAAIWRRFERGANRLNATSPGLGIGLAIVDAILTSHGGTARYRRSELLGGACFSLHLPDVVAQVIEPAPPLEQATDWQRGAVRNN